ncbi:MAG TPA: hypothetical protein VMU30_03840 [Bacteroidota bacterium]|nr:hypothetical protein [Bacteroidota bacterium]
MIIMDTVASKKQAISIYVAPQAASNAVITVVQKSKFILYEYGSSEYEISPDTVRKQPAPLRFSFPLGNYDFIVSKEGFRTIIHNMTLGKDKCDSVLVDMNSFEYLRYKYNQWGSIKWTNAGLAACAGIISYFLHSKIESLKQEYNTALSQSVADDKRSAIAKYQNYYTISSSVTFTFIGAFGLSWAIQGTYQ